MENLSEGAKIPGGIFWGYQLSDNEGKEGAKEKPYKIHPQNISEGHTVDKERFR